MPATHTSPDEIAAEHLARVPAPVVVRTFMRSGTHFTMDSIRGTFGEFRRMKRPLAPFDSLYLPVDVLLDGWPSDGWTRDRCLRILNSRCRTLVKSHALEPDLANLGQTQPALAHFLRRHARFIHIVRDPRSVLPSLWAMQGDFIAGHDTPERRTAFIEEKLHAWKKDVRAWHGRPGTLLLKFEPFLHDFAATMETVRVFLGCRPPRFRPVRPARQGSRRRAALYRAFSLHPPSTEIRTTRKPERWLTFIRDCDPQRFQHELDEALVIYHGLRHGMVAPTPPRRDAAATPTSHSHWHFAEGPAPRTHRDSPVAADDPAAV